MLSAWPRSCGWGRSSIACTRRWVRTASGASSAACTRWWWQELGAGAEQNQELHAIAGGVGRGQDGLRPPRAARSISRSWPEGTRAAVATLYAEYRCPRAGAQASREGARHGGAASPGKQDPGDVSGHRRDPSCATTADRGDPPSVPHQAAVLVVLAAWGIVMRSSADWVRDQLGRMGRADQL